MFPIDPDIRKASTLPGEFYTDPRTFDQCRDRVFSRTWQFVGDAERVKAPGQAWPVTLLPGFLDEPLLFTRDHDDRVHCLANVCTHRGNLLVEGPCQARQLRCRYHGRTFHLDGRMQSMPEFEGVDGFPSAADDLPRVPWAAWKRFLFVALDPPESLPAVFRPLDDRVGWLPLEDFCREEATCREYLVRANWALYCDNYLEGFHIPFVHPALNQSLDYGSYTTELFPSCNLQLGIARDGEECFDLPGGHPDAGRRVAAYYFWVFPNLMLNFYPWGLSVNVVRPLEVGLTRVEFLTYLWRPEKRRDAAGLDRVEREDEAVVECVQRGVRSRFYGRGRYSPTREQGVHHFHRLLAGRCAGAGQAARPGS
jgi:choline monooxygenase